MKKLTLILTIFLSLSISAQNSPVLIDGFGSFKFGMTKKEVQNAIKKHKTPTTKVQNLKTHIEIQNIELYGTVFDNCLLSVDNALTMGTFSNYFSTRAGAELQFGHLLELLQKKHGDSPASDWSTAWYDKNNNIILLKIEEKDGKVVLLLSYMTLLSY